jgi:hypothetical protein
VKLQMDEREMVRGEGSSPAMSRTRVIGCLLVYDGIGVNRVEFIHGAWGRR